MVIAADLAVLWTAIRAPPKADKFFASFFKKKPFFLRNRRPHDPRRIPPPRPRPHRLARRLPCRYRSPPCHAAYKPATSAPPPRRTPQTPNPSTPSAPTSTVSSSRLSLWQHPRFFGTSPPTPNPRHPRRPRQHRLGVLGLSWQSSPRSPKSRKSSPTGCDRWSASPRLEWLIQDSASTSTLVPSSAPRARHQLLAHRAAPASRASPLTVYVSAHSHSSVDKDALLAGFGRANLRSSRSTTPSPCAPMRWPP